MFQIPVQFATNVTHGEGTETGDAERVVKNITYRSNTSSSNWFRSQAIYSSDASVMRGHHDKSSVFNFCRFSAISSMPSSVTLLHPDNERTVKCGSECTVNWESEREKETRETNKTYRKLLLSKVHVYGYHYYKNKIYDLVVLFCRVGIRVSDVVSSTNGHFSNSIICFI